MSSFGELDLYSKTVMYILNTFSAETSKKFPGLARWREFVHRRLWCPLESGGDELRRLFVPLGTDVVVRKMAWAWDLGSTALEPISKLAHIRF